MEKDQKGKAVDQELGLVPTQQDGEVVDAVFGTITEDGPKFCDVSVYMFSDAQLGRS